MLRVYVLFPTAITVVPRLLMRWALYDFRGQVAIV
jgi:hypothetical protein